MSDEARVLTFSCPVHGQIHSERVFCRHEAEDVTRRVCNAHSAPYGAGCSTPLDLELVDPETEAVESTGRHYPGQPMPSGDRTAGG